MGKGKRKIEMKKIESLSARNVAFSKRRTGLFNKAMELCNRHNLSIGAVVFSPAGNIYEFGDAFSLSSSFVEGASPEISVASQEDIMVSEITSFLDVDVSKLSIDGLQNYSLQLDRVRKDLVAFLESKKNVENFRTSKEPVNFEIFQTPNEIIDVQNFQIPYEFITIENFQTSNELVDVENFQIPEEFINIENFQSEFIDVENFQTPNELIDIERFQIPEEFINIENFQVEIINVENSQTPDECLNIENLPTPNEFIDVETIQNPVAESMKIENIQTSKESIDVEDFQNPKEQQERSDLCGHDSDGMERSITSFDSPIRHDFLNYNTEVWESFFQTAQDCTNSIAELSDIEGELELWLP